MTPSPKTYVVAGVPRSGTTAAMMLHMNGGIPGLYRGVPHPDNPYPHQVYEFSGGKLRMQDVLGKVVKRFQATLVQDLPDAIENVHVMYMFRDLKARLLAHPGEAMKAWVHGGANDQLEVEWEHKAKDNIAAIEADPRVAQVVRVDYDDLVNNPLGVVSRLKAFGWELDVTKAAWAIDPTLRHAARGDTEAVGGLVTFDNSKKVKPQPQPVVTDAPSMRIIEKHMKRRGM